jgi:hypothetical protein
MSLVYWRAACAREMANASWRRVRCAGELGGQAGVALSADHGSRGDQHLDEVFRQSMS